MMLCSYNVTEPWPTFSSYNRNNKHILSKLFFSIVPIVDTVPGMVKFCQQDAHQLIISVVQQCKTL